MINLTNIWPERPLVTAAGFVFCLAGLVMLVLPGPGALLLALGLSVLGSEYLWARKLMRRLRNMLARRGL
ncbi:MAG: PGPGW domain-containing protein [Lysobacterales bacterium]